MQSLRDNVEGIRGAFMEDTTHYGVERTLLRHLLTSDLPQEEKTSTRLTGELVASIVGGVGAIEHTLTLITYHVSANPDIQTKLRESLRQEHPHSFSRAPHLAQIPYLDACVNEGLRYSSSPLLVERS
jgi:cytochrome P450